jgi:hypothetical protein
MPRLPPAINARRPDKSIFMLLVFLLVVVGCGD